MITSTVTLCALPDPIWREKTKFGNEVINIHSFVEDALAIENRIRKGVNQENERARLTLCCSRLEAAIKNCSLQEIKSPSEFKSALTSSALPVVVLGQNYLNAIKLMYQKAETKSGNIRLGATYFPPYLVETHINAFATLATELSLSDLADVKLRIAFYQFALKNHCGVIEFQNPFTYQDQVIEPQVSSAKVEKPEIIFQLQDDDEGAFDNEGEDASQILREQITRALQNAKEGKPSAVNFSNQPHNVITEVLNEFIYSDTEKLKKPTYIQVIYTDGSQGEDFPLQCLPQHEIKELDRLSMFPPLRASLLSMRHLEMDDKVDISWFRNREVSKARAFSETDQFCYSETKRQLDETRKIDAFVLHLYQTGLQPAIIGFYRALIEELLHRAKQSPTLMVIPFYFRGKSGYKQGKSWA